MINKSRIGKIYEDNIHTPKLNGIYLGIVRQVVDTQRMGRLIVWISELGPDEEGYWIPASYASPFAGTTDVRDNGEGSTEEDSQKSYGFWATPPDVNNQVLVCFVNGDIMDGYWFACLYPQNMNHMVPGVGFSQSDDTNYSSFSPYGPPTVEYNKKDNEIVNPTARTASGAETVNRPVFKPLADGLIEQGLNNDPNRGVSNSSARRESPSRVFGLLSPRGSGIYIDDGFKDATQTDPEDEFIRIRTRSGTQILVNESDGYIYMISKQGKSWMEISDNGIDMYSEGNISMASDADINLCGANINIEGQQNVNINSTTLNTHSAEHTNIASGRDIRIQALDDVFIRATNNFGVDAGNNVGIESGEDTIISACGKNIRTGSPIADNPFSPPIAATVGGATFLSGQTVSRKPTHEPFNRGVENINGFSSDGTPLTNVVGSDGSVGVAPAPLGSLSDDDIEWLTTLMMTEVRGDSDPDSWASVAQVAIHRFQRRFSENRVNPIYKDRIKGYILALSAFSGFNASGHEATERKGRGLMARYSRIPRYAQMREVAKQVVAGTYQGGSAFKAIKNRQTTLWFFNPDAVNSRPNWERFVLPLVSVIDHDFYYSPSGTTQIRLR